MLFRKRAKEAKPREADLDDEIRHHIHQEAELRIERGESPEHALAEARRLFGNATRVKEDARGVWTRASFQTLLRDVRHTGRLMRRSPGFTTVVTITLAVAIGANTALFSVVDGVLLQPLPYDRPDELVRVHATHPTRAESPLSAADVYEYRAENRTFEDLVLFSFFEHEYAGMAGPEQLPGYVVSRGYFEMLGYAPALGRAFTADDEKPASVETVIVSHNFWQTRLGADPQIVGKSVTLSRRPFVVVGVMPPGLRHVGDRAASHGQAVDFWLPMQLQPGRLGRNFRNSYAAGRVKLGVSPREAEADLNRIAAALERDYPATNANWRARVTPLKQEIVGRAEPLLLASFSAAGFVLLIACANLACLLLARSMSRSREYALRMAIGAGRTQLVRQALTEALVLSIGGAALGFPLAVAGVRALLLLAPDNLPRREMIAVDTGMFLFAVVLTPVVSLLFGALPALRSARIDPGDVLRSGGRTASASGLHVYEALVACELALCLTLLAGAGLLARTFYNLKQAPLGIQPEGVLTAGIDIPGNVYSNLELRRGFYAKLLDDLRSRPGVLQAGLSTARPFSSLAQYAAFEVVGRPAPPNDPPRLRFFVASPGYFEAIGVPLREGRGLDQRDGHDAPPVVVVNEAMVRRHFPSESAVGRDLKVGNRTFRIAGVVGDVKDSPASLGTEPAVFSPHQQSPAFRVTLAIKTRDDASAGLRTLRSAVDRLDTSVPVFEVRPLGQIAADAIALQRFAVFLFALFAAVALLLALVGAYGVMAFLANSRTREFGIRLALGAQPATIARMVLRRALGIAGIGIAGGLLGAAALGRLLESYLYGVRPDDWGSRTAAILVLVIAMSYAALIPARKSANIDPGSMLRAD